MSARIALVDDDTELARALSRLLESKGYDCVTCTDPDKAVEVILETAPDLIILDVMMPGVSGYDVCRTLRQDERVARTPILFLSALADDEGGLLGIVQGGDDYLAKPFDMDDLLMRITILLEDYQRG